MSISPGVATPMAATSSSVSPAAATAWRIASHMVSRPGLLAPLGLASAG